MRKVNITTTGLLNRNTTQVYAIKNPLVFIYNSTTPYDWYANSATYQNNNLWSNIKSTYDPCPQGWQVPTDSEKTFGDFSTNNTFIYYIQGSQTSSGSSNVTNGRLYNQISWFPAAGYRYGVTGILNVVGIGSYSWSVSTSEMYSKRFFFNMDSIKPSSTSYRASSLPVRCVQE